MAGGVYLYVVIIVLLMLKSCMTLVHCNTITPKVQGT